MNAKKFIVATVVAVSVMGGIGYAYAQLINPSATASNPGIQQSMSQTVQTTPMDSTIPNAGRTMSGDGNGMSTERAARTDLN